MADFKTQVEDLIGSVGDDALITQSLIDIGGEIIGSLPNTKLLSSALAVAVSSSGLSVSNKKVLAVDKDDLPVRRVPASQKARHNDTGSIYAATDTNPVYYVEAETVYINGAAGDGATAGVLHYVPKLPTHNGSALISNGSDSVANFPLEAEYLLILGSSVRCLQRLMANKTSSLPSDIPEPVLSEISISLPTFTVPDSFVLIPAPVGADISYSSVPSSPSYVQPILSLGSTPTISDLTISSTSPVAPSSPSFTSPDISGIFNPASSPPSYTAPVLTLGATPSISDLTISSIVPVVPVSPSFTTPDISSTTLNNLGVPPVYTAPTKDKYFKLSPGQVVYGLDGGVIAQAPSISDDQASYGAKELTENELAFKRIRNYESQMPLKDNGEFDTSELTEANRRDYFRLLNTYDPDAKAELKTWTEFKSDLISQLGANIEYTEMLELARARFEANPATGPVRGRLAPMFAFMQDLTGVDFATVLNNLVTEDNDFLLKPENLEEINRIRDQMAVMAQKFMKGQVNTFEQELILGSLFNTIKSREGNEIAFENLLYLAKLKKAMIQTTNKVNNQLDFSSEMEEWKKRNRPDFLKKALEEIGFSEGNNLTDLEKDYGLDEGSLTGVTN